MSTAVAPQDIDLAPPAAALRAQIAAVMPRLRAVMNYVGALDQINLGRAQVTRDGMTIEMPDPTADAPEAAAAIRKARGRSSIYAQGNNRLFFWVASFSQYGALIANASTRIGEIYQAIPASGPTVAQRAEVTRYFTGLLGQLRQDSKLLADAEKYFIDAHTALEEDRPALGTGAPAMTAAIEKFEKRTTDQLLKWILRPETAGLARILQTTAGEQLSYLRKTQSSLAAASEACKLASSEVGQLAGSVLVIIGKYQGVDEALQRADDAAFRSRLAKFQLSLAVETWKELSAYAASALTS